MKLNFTMVVRINNINIFKYQLLLLLLLLLILLLGTAVAQWLRCCATNRKVAGSISDGVIGIFH